MPDVLNREVAESLEEAGRLLAEQGANVFRVHAYERAAQLVKNLERPVAEILRSDGMAGLERLPGIGVHLAQAIRDLVLLGRLPMLERLRGHSDDHALELLQSVPGIGARTADRLHHELGIQSLEALDAAVHDGRLAAIPGLRGKRLSGIRDSLAQHRHHFPRAVPTRADPPVAEILDVDREYRERAAAGELHRITPRLYNPRREARLPVLHTHRGERHYTALFSNSARAHELGMTGDWVVVYYDGPGHPEQQCTVITSRFGPLTGRRIIRGREGECAAYYQDPAHDRHP